MTRGGHPSPFPPHTCATSDDKSRSVLATHLRSAVLLSWRLRSRTVRKVPYQPTNLPGQPQLSADLHPPKECVKEGTNQPPLLGECGT